MLLRHECGRTISLKLLQIKISSFTKVALSLLLALLLRSKNKKAATPSLSPFFYEKKAKARGEDFSLLKRFCGSSLLKKKFLKSLARQLGKVVLSQNVRTALGREPRNARNIVFCLISQSTFIFFCKIHFVPGSGYECKTSQF